MDQGHYHLEAVHRLPERRLQVQSAVLPETDFSPYSNERILPWLSQVLHPSSPLNRRIRR